MPIPFSRKAIKFHCSFRAGKIIDIHRNDFFLLTINRSIGFRFDLLQPTSRQFHFTLPFALSSSSTLS
jgi:hypothetical protein